MDKAKQNFSGFDPCWTAEKQAQWWVVHMDIYGTDEAVRTRFETWLAEDVDHAVAYFQNENLWSDMSLAFDMKNEDSGLHIHPVVPVALKRRKYWIYGATLCVLISLLWFLPELHWRMADYTNDTLSQKKIVLVDGTVVTLDGKSAINVDYRDDLRQISLAAGQAFFDVHSNKKRAFVVQAGSVKARALGTAYSVRKRDDRVTVSVREGMVDVTAEGIENAVHLKALESVTIDPDIGKLQKMGVNQNAFAWLEGHLVAQNRLLHDLLGELERYSDSRIFVLSPALREKKISGRFDVTNSMQAVEDIVLLLGADLIKITGGIIFIK